MTLDEYLADQSQRRWRWGHVDCVQFGLGWARARSGRPLAAFFDYAGRREALTALQARGGLARIVEEWMALHQFAAVADPDDGDIGLCPVYERGDYEIAGASLVIRSGPWWIGKSVHGIASTTAARDIPAWRIA